MSSFYFIFFILWEFYTSIQCIFDHIHPWVPLPVFLHSFGCLFVFILILSFTWQLTPLISVVITIYFIILSVTICIVRIHSPSSFSAHHSNLWRFLFCFLFPISLEKISSLCSWWSSGGNSIAFTEWGNTVCGARPPGDPSVPFAIPMTNGHCRVLCMS